LIEWTNPAGHGEHYAEPYHAGLFRAALGVDDTRASYEYLTSTGAVFDRPPMEVELSGTPVPDMWITFISDPNGIPYEFVQRPRKAFR
jgi:catechol 2,3-dioxygenase-like lactoylglutathione lyase family enzyme